MRTALNGRLPVPYGTPLDCGSYISIVAARDFILLCRTIAHWNTMFQIAYRPSFGTIDLSNHTTLELLFCTPHGLCFLGTGVPQTDLIRIAIPESCSAHHTVCASYAQEYFILTCSGLLSGSLVLHTVDGISKGCACMHSNLRAHCRAYRTVQPSVVALDPYTVCAP